jgi:GTP-binding protein Era
MTDFDVPDGHRSGYVALIGRPNVGKSTLINNLLGQTIAAVSARPQTTRKRQLGILTLPRAQIIFVDTPGIHKPKHKLGDAMNISARESLEDADILLVLFDLSETPQPDDRRVAEAIQRAAGDTHTFVVLNKVDALTQSEIDPRAEAFQELLSSDETMTLSAVRPEHGSELVERLVEHLPEGPRYYPEAQVTVTYEREIAADIIRAAAMGLLRQELPHSIAVHVQEYKERDEEGAYIRATIYVERESQKGIVIGKGGRMLKAIGTAAREQIEAMSARSVYLELRVKVMPKWRNDEDALARLGYLIPKG